MNFLRLITEGEVPANIKSLRLKLALLSLQGQLLIAERSIVVMDPFACPIAESPFTIKDLLLGEFLCHALVLSDEQFLRATAMARKVGNTIGSTLCSLGWLTQSELFAARRILNRYLDDPGNVDEMILLLEGVVKFKPQSDSTHVLSMVS